MTEQPAGNALLVRRPDMTTVTVEDSLFVYDECGQRFFVLNTSAAAVYELVDGRCGQHDIAEALATVHPDQAESVRTDVYDALAGLLELGVIAESAGP